MSHAAETLFDLTGRVAVITGGAGLLGRQHAAIIRAFGGTVVIADVREEIVQEAATALGEGDGGPVMPITVDITSKASVDDMVAKVLDRHGRIDILINNAAMTVKHGGASSSEYFAPFEEYRLDLWQRAIDTNLTGLFLCTQAVGRVMVRQQRGVVLNMASDLSVIAPDHRIYDGESFNTPVTYSVSKTGVVGFTRYLATYWAKHNIRVNALSPAGVFDNHSAQFVQKLSALIPLGRMANRNEYQGAVLFLVSDASSFMTGANLVIDGGRTSW